MKNDKIIGYLIYNSMMKRIHQMAIAKEHRNIGLGSHLLNYISTIEKQAVSFINMDYRMNNFKTFLEKRGLKNNFNQFEMEFNIR